MHQPQFDDYVFKCRLCVCPGETLSTSSQPDSAALGQFNKSWAELTDWLTMLDNMVQNKKVVVADLDDIGDNINQLKVRTSVVTEKNRILNCLPFAKGKKCLTCAEKD